MRKARPSKLSCLSCTTACALMFSCLLICCLFAVRGQVCRHCDTAEGSSERKVSVFCRSAWNCRVCPVELNTSAPAFLDLFGRNPGTTFLKRSQVFSIVSTVPESGREHCLIPSTSWRSKFVTSSHGRKYWFPPCVLCSSRICVHVLMTTLTKPVRFKL